MRKSIYNRDAWEYVLEKYPDLKRQAVELGLENRPGRVKEMRKEFKESGKKTFTEKEIAFLINVGGIEFVEERLWPALKKRADEATLAGAIEDKGPILEVLSDLSESVFDEFLKSCNKRNLDVEHMAFSDAYNIFLGLIVLKMENRVTLTKYFIKRLLEMREDKEEFSTEIKNYFMKQKDYEVLAEIRKNLLLDYSNNI